MINLELTESMVKLQKDMKKVARDMFRPLSRKHDQL